MIFSSNLSKYVGFTPLCNLITQDKFLPLKMSKIIFEFELVGSYLDAIQNKTAATPSAVDLLRKWKITDVQLEADILQIDSSVHYEYTKHVLAREHLPTSLSSFSIFCKLQSFYRCTQY